MNDAQSAPWTSLPVPTPAGPPTSHFARLWTALSNELARTQAALAAREAELAATVTVRLATAESVAFATRLEQILAGACTAVGCTAAGLYLLDDATTSLKLRSAHGLPAERLVDGPRPLASALADLEALCGHALALETAESLRQWQPPEACGAALCVPVSTSQQSLGTLWFFAPAARTFDNAQTLTAELVAGRLATEIERETLLAAVEHGRRAAKDLERAADLASLGPRGQITRAGSFEFAGWTAAGETLGGDFSEWFPLATGRMALVVGDALGQGASAALIASQARGALRAHAAHCDQAGRLLARVNQTLCQTVSLEPAAQMFCATLDVGTGLVGYASAGAVRAWRLRSDGRQMLVRPGPPLGLRLTTHYVQYQLQLDPGETLLVATDGVVRAIGPDALERALSRAGAANELVRVLSEQLVAADLRKDMALAVVRHAA